MATIKKNQTAEIPTKNGGKYSYQYVDIAQIHEYLEEKKMSYYQYIDRIDGDDYIMTVKVNSEGKESLPLRGSRVVDATLYGNDNPAQKQGSAITYARRYSLLMAFGLATEDDNANKLSNTNGNTRAEVKATQKQIDMLNDLCTDEEIEKVYKSYSIKDLTELTINQASALISRKMGK